MKLSELPAPVYHALAENLEIEKFADVGFSRPTYPIKLSSLIDKIIAGDEIKPIGKYSFDSARKILRTTKKEMPLTEKEAAIISVLVEGQNFSNDEILHRAWGYSKDIDTNTLETHIYRLRQKILDNFGEELIVTENGKYNLKK